VRTASAQSPYTTDGIAASRSTEYTMGLRNQFGAISVTNNAIPRLIGTEIRSAMKPTRKVP
jgi:hypothetical protein